jgi:hypothetical protein
MEYVKVSWLSQNSQVRECGLFIDRHSRRPAFLVREKSRLDSGSYSALLESGSITDNIQVHHEDSAACL